MLELLLIVNIQTRQVCVVDADKANRPPLACYPAAVAKNPNNTPRGKFSIERAVINPSFTSCRTGVNHGQGFLGTLAIVTNLETTPGCSYAIHGTNQENLIGLEVTDGCSRLRNKDANHLKENYLDSVTGGYIF